MAMVTAKAFQLLKMHYPGTTVPKLECVGQVQKRVGCRLRNLKKQERYFGERKADQ